MSRKARLKKQAAQEAKPAPPPAGWLWALLAAAFAPLLVYWRTVGYTFLLDDFVLFKTSPSLSDLGSIPRGFLTDVGALRKGTDTVISSYYRPVFLALSTVYYKLVGGDPAAWHAASFVVAALIGALACGFFLRLGLPPLVALLASLVFSLHPAHVSSVAWASGLQELLAALFVLCALHAMLTARSESRVIPSLVLAALFYSLALLSKEVAIGLLPFAGLWAFSKPKSDSPDRRLWQGTAVLAGVTVFYLAVRIAVLGGLAVPAENAPSFRASLFAVPVAFVTYLRLLIWPFGFSIFRPERPVYGLFSAPVLISLAVVAVLAGLAGWAIRKKRDLLLPLGWLVLWLLPVLNLWALDPQWMVTDRYLFLPSLALPWGLAFLKPRRTQIVVLSVLAVVFAILTVRYTAIFHDERTFMAAMEKAEPTSPLIFAEKGRLLLQDGNIVAARAALTRSVELDPIAAPEALQSLGDLELQQGELDAAEGHYRKALVVRPEASRGFKLVALALSRAGQRDKASALIEESAQRWPDDFEVQLLHALFLGEAGEREKAQAALDAARRLRPGNPAVAGGLDEVLARLLPTLQPPRG